MGIWPHEGRIVCVWEKERESVCIKKSERVCIERKCLLRESKNVGMRMYLVCEIEIDLDQERESELVLET